MNEEIKNIFSSIGYLDYKETKTYIEAKKGDNLAYDRIKVYKEDLSVQVDNRTHQGNRGHKRILYKEFVSINKIIKILRSDK